MSNQTPPAADVPSDAQSPEQPNASPSGEASATSEAAEPKDPPRESSPDGASEPDRSADAGAMNEAISVEALLDRDEADARAAEQAEAAPVEANSDEANLQGAASDAEASDAEASDAEASDAEASDAEAVDERTFEDLGLEPKILKALDDMGYQFPMPVQLAVYDQLIAKKDVMVQSRTGSGKTAGFGIPIVQRLSASTPGAQALILAPTRELALQVARELDKLSVHKGLSVAPIYGGAPMKKQVDQLRAGAQIIAGTPGRVLDHLRRKTLQGEGITTLVLDECDEMLSMGFQEEIEKIISFLPPREERQTVLFSATIPPEIQRIARRHMVEPEEISLSDDGVGVAEIEHFYYVVTGMARTRDLLKVIKTEEPESAIIFCNTREDTNVVSRFLRSNGYDAEAISGDLTQAERERVMGRKRAQDLRFLVATDVAARGIDISDLSHVINYTFPESPEVYVHRTGRTGRAGKSGVAVSLVGPRELSSFYYLKLIYKIRPTERDLPSSDAMSAILEGERYRDLVGRVAQEPADEYRSLARRVWQSHEGERIVAFLLQQLLTRPAAAQSPSAHESRAETPQNGERPRDRDRDRDEPRREGRRGRDRDRDRDDNRREGRRGRDRDRDDHRRSRSRDRDREDGRRSRSRDRDESRSRDRDESRSRDRDESRSRDRDENRSRDRDENRSRDRDERRRDRDRDREERRERREERKERRTRRDGESGTSTDERPRRSRSRDAAPRQDERPMKVYDSTDASTGYDQNNPEDREFWEVWADEVASRPTGASADSSPPAHKSDRSNGEAQGNGEGHSVRLFVNLGKREEITEDQVRELLGDGLGDDAKRIGSIALRTNHCYVRVPEELVERVIDQVTGKSFKDRAVVVERARR